jgi:hypothetical protein
MNLAIYLKGTIDTAERLRRAVPGGKQTRTNRLAAFENYVADHQPVKASKVQDGLGLSYRMVRDYMAELIETGRIERIPYGDGFALRIKEK